MYYQIYYGCHEYFYLEMIRRDLAVAGLASID